MMTTARLFLLSRPPPFVSAAAAAPARYFRTASVCLNKSSPDKNRSNRTPLPDMHTRLADYEAHHHLGRSLSRVDVTPKQQRLWSGTAKKFKRWDLPVSADDLFRCSRIQYELEALRSIHSLSYEANVLLEIRDVRLPASSHHPSFTRLAKHRTHLIVYTHSDLIDEATRDRVRDWTLASWPKSQCAFVDTASDKRGKDQIVESYDKLYDWIADVVDRSGGLNSALTVGVPNTGKSSVVTCLLRNAKMRDLIAKKTKSIALPMLDGSGPPKKSAKKRRKNVSKKAGSPVVQDVPGKTRTLTEYLLRDKPKMYFLDVPGMTPPPDFFAQRPDAWYGFGAANLLVTGRHKLDPSVERDFCAYVLRCANRDGMFQYAHKLGLNGPTSNIDEALSKLSHKYADRMDGDKLLSKRCETFLKLFNTGNFGPLILDDLSRPYLKWNFVSRDEDFPRQKFRRGDGYDDDEEWEGGGRRSAVDSGGDDINYW